MAGYMAGHCRNSNNLAVAWTGGKVVGRHDGAVGGAGFLPEFRPERGCIVSWQSARHAELGNWGLLRYKVASSQRRAWPCRSSLAR
jgi:hypothetical protein